MSSVAAQVGPGNLPKSGNAFIDSVSMDAVRSQIATGVPASVTLAQAILESGWGKSGLSKKYHNYFGIKGKGTAGTAVMSTGEHLNGQDVVIKDGFRVYRSAAESFEDHGRFFIVNKRYATAMKHTDDAEQFAREIHKAGYATDPNYSQKLIGIIRQYKLAQFDAYAKSHGATAPKTGSQGAVPTSVMPPKTTTVSASSKEAVKDLQQLLVKYGYMTQEQMQTGPGVLGPKTKAAVTRLLEEKSRGTSNVIPLNPGGGGKGATGGSGGSASGGGQGSVSGGGSAGKPTVNIPPPVTAGNTSKLTYAQISQDFHAKIPGSKHFSWHEALWLPSYKRYANAGEVNPTILANIVRQAQALDRVRDHFKKSIVVHCWLRPPAYNKKVGGAKNSAHLRGAATDFHMEGLTAEQVRQVLLKDKSIYPGAGELKVSWVHLDLEHKAWFAPW